MKQKIIFLSITILFALAGCKSKNENHAGHDSGTYYTCPMHPTVKSNSPGSCPVCNMSLIKVEKQNNEHAQQAGNFITIEKKQQQLAGIKTDTVKFQNIFSSSTILGTVAIDEEQVTTISSRVKGRLDKLYIKTSGEYIRKGNPVYAIYSEQLFADEKEFLVLSENKINSNAENKLLNDMLSASKNKLLLWGLSEKQIEELEKNKSASPQIVFYAQTEGYVTEILVKEGAYVEEGTLLIKLTALNQVWIDAQVYSNEIEKISGSNSFQVFSETYPDEIYTGRLVFSNPSVENGRKVQLLRLKVDNSKNKLIPGMMVYVSPKQNSKPVLAVPKSAVLLEKMKTVWVLAHNNTFEQRMVETGAENKFWIEILSGLKEGETVVTEGAYLISSEFILKSGAGQRHDH
ncbi:MAG: efflux RND transporter periplasmic adaptor subunit [Flavobacteriales bacterium]|nr:efflux RND transporter periplasmic adaptor subunit [Flavobacteriales bacterium]